MMHMLRGSVRDGSLARMANGWRRIDRAGWETYVYPPSPTPAPAVTSPGRRENETRPSSDFPMSHRTLLSLSLAAGALLSGCADSAVTPLAVPSDATRIVNGSFDSKNMYPSVGALMFDWDHNGLSGNDEFCTGSLISPTVFLT